MCGIAGIINFQRSEAVDESALRRMCALLAHRGPDDEGFYIAGNLGFGNRRLAVIDVSEQGHQPLSNEDGSVWVTFNGEIYNYQELRHNLQQRGHSFASQTDTEVIVHAYEEFGLEFVDHLDGMFALAVWDCREQTLVLARDRLGEKSLYYSLDGQRLLFASELRSIIKSQHAQLDLRIDAAALRQYLIFGCIPAPSTILTAVRKLLPGELLVVRDGRCVTKRYWQSPRDVPPAEADEAALLARFHDALQASVRRRMRSDVPLGAFLSGGIDSTCVVGVAAGLTDLPLQTFSIGYDDPAFDESRYAREVASYFGTKHTELILGAEDVSASIIDIMSRFDEPFYDHSAVPTYLVAHLAKRSVTVVLSGDGGDELFFGYKHLLHHLRRYEQRRTYEERARGNGTGGAWLERMPWSLSGATHAALTRCTPEASFARLKRRLEDAVICGPYRDWPEQYLAWYAHTPRRLRRALLGRAGEEAEAAALRAMFNDGPEGDGATRLAAFDLQHYLPNDILTKVDRMSMQHALEVRIPLLAHGIVEFAAHIPTALKLQGSNQKHFLKRYLQCYLIHDPRLLDLVTREKHGFRFPIGRYIEGPLKSSIEAALRDTNFQRGVGLRPEGVEETLACHAKRRRAGKTVWLLFCLYLWWANHLQ